MSSSEQSNSDKLKPGDRVEIKVSTYRGRFGTVQERRSTHLRFSIGVAIDGEDGIFAFQPHELRRCSS